MPLPPPAELVNPNLRRGPFRLAVFDFDGTVSLIREGWSGIMADLGVELLGEPDRHAELELEMLRLSGKPSIWQMRRLAEIVTGSGRTLPDPDELLGEFARRLANKTNDRKRRLAEGIDPPAAWAVSGTHTLLAELQKRGVVLTLVSGTAAEAVHEEARLLGLTEFFDGGIFAPTADSPQFTKGEVLDALIRERSWPGELVVGFGDGYAETVETKRIGGVAVGVASHEVGIAGVNTVKRDMLVELGADLIVPDYSTQDRLIPWLFGDV